MKRPVTVTTLVYALCASVLCSACDEARDLADPERLEHRLRNDPTRSGKVGAIAAVAVRQRAASVAQRASTALDPLCALEIDAGSAYAMTLTLDRKRGATLIASWHERRTFRHDRDGNLELSMEADFITQTGIEGRREDAWRLVDGRSFLGTRVRDGHLWYEREADASERRRVEAAGLGSLQALLDSVDTWRGSGPTWVSDPGGTKLACVATNEGLGWIDRFVTRAVLKDARLTVADGGRTLHARWALEDGSVLSAHLTDEMEPHAERIPAPPPADTVDVLRDRSLGSAVKLLEKLAAQGLVEVGSEVAPTLDENSDD